MEEIPFSLNMNIVKTVRKDRRMYFDLLIDVAIKILCSRSKILTEFGIGYLGAESSVTSS